MKTGYQADTMIKGGAAALVAIAGAAQAQDFDGLYAGFSYSSGSGHAADPDDNYTFGGNAGGAFVGYNFVQDNWLFGAELAVENGTYESFDGGQLEIGLSNMRQIKARAGRIFGNVLVYGVISHANTDAAFGPEPSDPEPKTGNMAFGLGLEANLGKKTFAGLEYLTQDYEYDPPYDFRNDQGSVLKTLTLRVGMRF